MKPTSSSKKTAEVYCFRFDDNRCRWANFTLCEETGEFSVQSDCGSWSYMWPRHGRASLKAFIAEGDAHYILDKFSYDNGNLRDEFDPEATVAAVRAEVVAARRRHDLSKSDARDLWELASENTDSLNLWVANMSGDLYEFLGNEPWSHALQRRPFVYDTMAQAVLPFFFGVLREELRRAA